MRNKTGARKLSKTTKPKRRNRAKNPNGGTPSGSATGAIESRASPVVMISEMIEPSCEEDEDLGSPAIPADSRRRMSTGAASAAAIRRASMMSAGRRSIPTAGGVQQRIDSDESHSTINSLLASPCAMAEDEEEGDECELSQFTVDHDVEDENADGRTPRGTVSAGRGIFSRIFRGIFGFGGGDQSALTVPPIATDLNDSPAIYEVIHVFPNPQAASGHEGLMIRSRARLERMGCADSADLARFPLSMPISQMPAEDKVVLLRRVISPRPMNLSSATATDDEIIDKASHRPELWLFVTYEDCRKHYSKELCDYYNYRVVHRGSEIFQQSQQSEDEEMGDEDVGQQQQQQQQQHEETPDQFFSTNLIQSGANEGRFLETPLQEDIENTLPPNSVEAPLKEVPCQLMEGVTPIILPTPPQIMNKSQDLGP